MKQYYQNISSLVIMLTSLPLLLVCYVIKILLVLYVGVGTKLTPVHYDKSKEWKIVKSLNKFGEHVFRL